MATAPSVPTAVEARPANHRTLRPWLAAVLSFIFPGLGQAYAGNPRMAAVFAIPMLLLVTAALLVLGLFGAALRNAVLSSGFLVGVLALNAVVFGWRGLAIWHAGLTPASLGPGIHRRSTALIVGALVVLALGMHGWVGVVVAHLDDTLAQVFDGRSARGGADAGTGSNGLGAGDDPGGGDADPINAPEYRWDGEERINVLLIGTDDAPGRDEILTDVIMVVSVDPVARTAVMISVPRDTGYLPLPDETIYADGVFPGKANELAPIASADPDLWCPGRDLRPSECGIRAVQQAVGLYMGLDLQHYALVDMPGFAELIHALGGVDLCLPGRLVDPLFGATLSASDEGELVLPQGCHRYNGIEALAYARSRQGWIELPDGTVDYQTDFDRNERQQLLLLAVRNELADSDLIFELPAVLSAIGRTVDTDFPRDQAGDLASLLPLITGPDIERVVLDYPEFVDAPLDPDLNYLLVPRRDSIREEMGRLFGPDELVGWYLATDAASPSAAESSVSP